MWYLSKIFLRYFLVTAPACSFQRLVILSKHNEKRISVFAVVVNKPFPRGSRKVAVTRLVIGRCISIKPPQAYLDQLSIRSLVVIDLTICWIQRWNSFPSFLFRKILFGSTEHLSFLVQSDKTSKCSLLRKSHVFCGKVPPQPKKIYILREKTTKFWHKCYKIHIFIHAPTFRQLLLTACEALPTGKPN